MSASAPKERAFELVRGLRVAIPTPFPTLEVDEPALRRSAEHYVSGMGSTASSVAVMGEFWSMTLEPPGP